ncbi:MAG: TolC family protein [Ghiorsea sp.]|nr:TolC family protein [Ghiorsea sp.]
MSLPSVIQRLTWFALICVAPVVGHAADTLSLKDSVSFALEHNRMLSVSKAQVQAAEAQADAATGQLMPRLDVSTGLFRTNSPLNTFGTKLQQQGVTAADFAPTSLNSPAYINNYLTRLNLTMPLFAGGANWAARSAAKSQAQASTHQFDFHKQQLIYQTIAAYVQTRQALAQVEAQQHAVRAASNRWHDAKALKKRGIAIESDVMDAHVYVLRNQVALAQAKAQYQDSLENLRFVLGMNHAKDTPALAEPVIHFEAESVDALLTQAYANRADLLALQNTVEATNAGKRQAQAAYYPHVNLLATQEWNSDTFGLKNNNTTVGLNVSMNLFAGGSSSAQSRAAESKRIMASLQLEDKRQQIANEVRQAWRGLHIAEQRLQSETEALNQTLESLRIKSLRQQQGLEKTSDLLDAQARADASRVTQIQAKYDYMIAKAALLLAAGTLHEGVVQ